MIFVLLSHTLLTHQFLVLVQNSSILSLFTSRPSAGVESCGHSHHRCLVSFVCVNKVQKRSDDMEVHYSIYFWYCWCTMRKHKKVNLSHSVREQHIKILEVGLLASTPPRPGFSSEWGNLVFRAAPSNECVDHHRTLSRPTHEIRMDTL